MAQLSDPKTEAVCLAAATMWNVPLDELCESVRSMQGKVTRVVCLKHRIAAAFVMKALQSSEPYEYLKCVNSAQFRQRTFSLGAATTQDHSLDAFQYTIQGLNATIK